MFEFHVADFQRPRPVPEQASVEPFRDDAGGFPEDRLFDLGLAGTQPDVDVAVRV